MSQVRRSKVSVVPFELLVLLVRNNDFYDREPSRSSIDIQRLSG